MLKLLHEFKSSSVRLDVREVGTGYGTCQLVLTKELGMHRVAAKFVSRILTADQKQQQFLAKHKWPSPPPTVPLVLAPCHFFLFPKMKLKLKGRQFDTTKEVQAESQGMLDTDRKGLPESVPKMKQTVGPVCTCGRELFRG
jgi:hypothetical protein